MEELEINATTGWFADSGGGSLQWESVNAHWNYMISAKTNDEGPRVVQSVFIDLYHIEFINFA